jgi:predicted 3-demethylubiquinone-9 3-methyltransferase (glyoxalase superfamily)
MQKITPFLWFDGNAEEAMNLYVSIFSVVGGSPPAFTDSMGRADASGGKNSKIVNVSRYGDEAAKVSGRPKGSVMTATFELHGQTFTLLNGGPQFKFTEAISFVVNCETQDEIDHYWTKLSEGGDEKAQQCGWLKDKFGVSWQIFPVVLGKLLGDKDPQKSQRVMQALLQMKKLVIADLQRAYDSA